MTTERLSMRHVREILRQAWELKQSCRQIARGLGLSLGAVGTTVRRAAEAVLTCAEASRSQQVADWLASNDRALAYFGGVPGAILTTPNRLHIVRVPAVITLAQAQVVRFEPTVTFSTVVFETRRNEKLSLRGYRAKSWNQRLVSGWLTGHSRAPSYHAS